MSAMDFIGGGAGAPPADLPPEIPDPDAPAAAPQDEVGSLRALIAQAREYIAIPTVQEAERLEMEKVTTILQKLLAQNERMSDQVTGATPQMRKALGPA